MNSKMLRHTMSVLAAVALIAPQGVSAICDIPFQKLQVGFTEVGQKTVGGNFGFGEGQTVLAGDLSTQFNEKWRGQFGLGICRIGSTEITYGFKIDTELFRSEDGKTGVFAGAGANRISANGVSSLLLPVTVYGTMIVSPLATLFFGPSLSYVRTSNGVFSGSNTNLGFQGGVMYELQEGLCLVVGGDFQNFEFGSTFRVQTGVYFDLK